jgi:hypothetical protein
MPHYIIIAAIETATLLVIIILSWRWTETELEITKGKPE